MKSLIPLKPMMLTLGLACIFSQDSGAAIIINDGFTNVSNYFGTRVEPVESTNYSYLNYDGTPENTLVAEHIHDSERDEETNLPLNTGPLELQSLFRLNTVSYTPSVSGVINTLSFKIDYRTTDPFSELFLFIEQQGSGVGGGFTAINNPGDQDGNWHTLEVLGLTDADFLGQGFFSASNPLRFGFGFISSATLDPFGTDPIPFQIEVDNFQVTVNPVPEPSSAVLLLGACALLFRKKR